MTKPSSVSRSRVRRRRADSLTQSSCNSRQKLASAPRPTRPRNWWSWARPKRSACSITITDGFGHIDADLHDRGGDQQPDRAGGKRGEGGVADLRRLLAVREADTVAEPEFQVNESLLRGGDVQRLTLGDQRTDPIDLGAFVQFAGDPLQHRRHGAERVEGGADRQAAGGFFGQAADVHFAPLGQQQRPWDRRRGHDQDVGVLAFRAERQALGDAEAVLLVDHRQCQVAIFDGVLEQGVGADDNLDRAVLDAAQQAARAPCL